MIKVSDRAEDSSSEVMKIEQIQDQWTVSLVNSVSQIFRSGSTFRLSPSEVMEIEQNLLQSSFTTYRSVFQSFRAAEISPSEVMSQHLRVSHSW